MFTNNPDKFDQHFLINEEVINTFIKEANLASSDVVVEIGPGKGQISSLIAPKVKKLILVELDERLKPFLEELQSKYNNIEVIYGSALDVFIPECDKIVTSLPYSIVEPFINKMLKCNFKELLMITGKKYAAGVRDNSLNNLSLLTNCYFDNKYIMDITPDSFNPEPRVMSSMIKLTPKSDKDISDFNLLMFRYMFYFRDKKVRNALIESLIRVNELKGNKLTKKESKSIIDSVLTNETIKEKLFSTCSNEEISILNDLIGEINND